MKLKAMLLIVSLPLLAIGLANAQNACTTCIGLEYCTTAIPNGYCACFFGEYGCQGQGLCKGGTCTSQVKGQGGNSCAKGPGPDFATDSRMSKALVDGVGAHSTTLMHLIDMLLPKIAQGTTIAGGFVGTKDHTEKTATNFSIKNDEFIFTIEHPVAPDTTDGPTKLVVSGHAWTLYRDSDEVASGDLSPTNIVE